MLCWIQELSVQTLMMQYVEVCDLSYVAGASRDILHYETVGNFCPRSTVNMHGKFFLPAEARQHPGVPCESLKFSSQLPASFLE